MRLSGVMADLGYGSESGYGSILLIRNDFPKILIYCDAPPFGGEKHG